MKRVFVFKPKSRDFCYAISIFGDGISLENNQGWCLFYDKRYLSVCVISRFKTVNYVTSPDLQTSDWSYRKSFIFLNFIMDSNYAGNIVLK